MRKASAASRRRRAGFSAIEARLSFVSGFSAHRSLVIPVSLLPMRPSAGARLGPYEIRSALGEGEMGKVYRLSERPPRQESRSRRTELQDLVPNANATLD